MGLRAHVVAARAPGPGDLAGLTQVCVDPAVPEWGFQELTAVAGPHRGHRLGLLLKLAMLDLLAARATGGHRIVTMNADGNQHMIAINEQLGFRMLSRWPSWSSTWPTRPGSGCSWLTGRSWFPAAARARSQRRRGGDAVLRGDLRLPAARVAGQGRGVCPAVRGPAAVARPGGRGRPVGGGQLAGFADGQGWRWAEQADDWAVQLQERLGGAVALLDGRWSWWTGAATAPPVRLGLQLLNTLVSATKTGAWLITQDEPTPLMALYQREGWGTNGHGPDTCDARPGLVLTHP